VDVQVIVQLIVAVGTPIAVYVAARKGQQGTAKTAADTDETNRRRDQNALFQWACERYWSENPIEAAGGLEVLKSMLLDERLGHDMLVAVAGVLEARTMHAINRMGDTSEGDVADEPPEGDADESK
jgi:hypothetical protein